jgi:peptidoglycan/xylan/chitin deacetylase (PgdA/CDA1 family)
MRGLAALLLVLLAVASPAITRADAGGVPILMYHRVDEQTPRDAVGRALTVTPRAFADQLAWLRAHRITTLTTAELVDALAHGRRPHDAIVLTFDDGYTDAATVALPLLKRYGAHASFYVSAGFIGDGRHMTWAQLRALRAAGMEVGCHGTFHLDLATIGQRAATREIVHCVDTLARYLARPTTYAYAAGRYDASLFPVLRGAGIAAALTERWGTVSTLAAPYVLPRRRVDRADGVRAFAALAQP